ncbi:hypothetical protein F2P81_006683 [Scophthalmus maximus]|uniref:Spatacsin C-terminal domain-containing protein n=1 Tax=Scophthalmus maximus TaxID=52904 RepID=A0A6A4T6K1_SCOMX|nr:hypothetical protein F2P81_006683 [Scophthalmus maximus]
MEAAAAQRPERSPVAVAVIPQNQNCAAVADIRRAEFAPGGSLLGCLVGAPGRLVVGAPGRLVVGAPGRLVVWDPADREAPPAAADGCCTDFSWEEEDGDEEEEVSVHSRGVSGCRLVAVGRQCDLKLLQVEAERSTSISLLHVADCPAGLLQRSVQQQDHGVCELRSLRVLSFAAGRCCVLLDDDWLLRLRWRQAEAEPQILSCCSIRPTDGDRHSAVHHCVCRDTLFTLSSDGIISLYDITDGRLLATVDLPAYLSAGLFEDDVVSTFPSSSPFCLLQVSADLSTAVAVTESHAAVAVDLDHYFRLYPDHLLCAARPALPALGPQQQLGDQDGLSSSGCCLAALGSTFSTDRRVPCGGATVDFSFVPESSASSLLAVSDFSALLTFVSPGNRQTTVVSWDFESGSVSYHQAEGEAAPLQRCGEAQHRLLLKRDGVFQVLFSVSQQDLLSRLMLFGSAATVDTVCHLNSWGRCSIPIHALQAGLKNRQLDTVDFYLKSKENVLNPATTKTFSAADQPTASTPSLTDDEDGGVRSCVGVLDRYVTELRSYMKRFPWPAGGDTTDSAAQTQREEPGDEWEELPTEELVRQSILTNQMPRAQAVLRRRSRPEQQLSALRTEGLRQVFSRLQQRDLQMADTLLVNMGFSVKKQLHSFCLYTDDKQLREFVLADLLLPRAVQMVRREAGAGEEVLGELVGPRRSDSDEDGGLWQNLRLDWVRNWDQSCQTDVLLSRLQHTGSTAASPSDSVHRLFDATHFLRTRVLGSAELSSCDAAVLWRYLTALHNQHRVITWIQNRETTGAPQWPELAAELVNDDTLCSTFMRENILDLLARKGFFIPEELADLDKLLWRLAQGGGVMASSPPIPLFRSPLGLDLHGLFVTFCLERGLKYLLYSYLEHYRLTPRNCPVLTNQSLSESQPWFEMLVKIQEITRDLSDPALLFQASLTSAQVLLPGSQASLSSLLLEGHSLLALAAIMFAPGGIDQVLVQGSGRSGRTVDPQLLKMALAPHSKLKAALFPNGPRGHSPSSDVSVYHLLQSLHPLDPSRLFGWQAANTLNSTETSELPHFSSPQLVNKFALVENLDFLYYVCHGRPSFAFATFLVQRLSGCGDVKLLWQQAQQQVYRLALQRFDVASVASAAVCFCELLGVCSLRLRVRSLVARFGPALQAHLNLAFQDLQLHGQRRSSSSETPPPPPPVSLGTEEVAGSAELFQVLLRSQEQASPGGFLLSEALVQRCPTLAVLAACQQDCPLVLVLRMFELCCDYRNFSEAKAKLLDFQRTLVTLRSGGAVPPGGGLPLQWVESQASVLLLTMLQRCSSQYDLHRLLQLLADVDKLLKSNGPDFRKLSQLSQLLQGSEVSLSPRLLQCSSPSVQQEEFQAAVDALQAGGRYAQARQAALLAGLPVHHLLLSQLLQELNSVRSKSQWRRLETRVSFWKKCQEQLKSDATDPGSASRFFLTQTEAEPQTEELPDVQERCLLLGLAAHWLALLSPAPVDKLQRLEKRLWVSRVRRHVLAAAMEKESVFNLPSPAVTPETNTYEALAKEFSFSNISALNEERWLGVDGLPGPGEQPDDLDFDSCLSPEDRRVLASLIGQLLDDGSIHEASRVCRYFRLYHPDVWVVLRCRGLASGELLPDPPEEAPEGEPRRSITASPSLSSLSLAAFPPPKDEVAVQLQTLLDQCRHGNNYCKQVLSLYQLSKELHVSFSHIWGAEPRGVLEMLLQSDRPERFRTARAFVRAQGLLADAVAELVSSAVTQALLASAQELQPGEDGVRVAELLVAAHDCFSLTCNMEGIVRVLQAARHLSHAYLAPGEHYSLMSCSLKTALLDYIKRCLPADSEKHNMVALCFSMRREIGENHEMAARTQLKIIESQAWVVTPDLKSSLVKVLGLLKDAAESFSKDSCVRQATRCVRTAKLVALQLHFLNQGSDVRVINLRPEELLSAVVTLPRCYQKVVLGGDFVYLEELKRHRPLTSGLFEDIFKKLDAAPGSAAPNVRRLLTHCDDVYGRYRLAYQHDLYDVTKTLLQDAKTSNYLNDRLAS